MGLPTFTFELVIDDNEVDEWVFGIVKELRVEETEVSRGNSLDRMFFPRGRGQGS